MLTDESVKYCKRKSGNLGEWLKVTSYKLQITIYLTDFKA